MFTEERRCQILNGVLAVFLACVIYSGFAYPLNYGDGMWPFNRDWFMFSSDDGYDFELQAEARFKDGSVSLLDVSQRFQFVIGSSNRFQEVARDEASMNSLAKYLCEKFQIEQVSIRDLSWMRATGRRRTLKDIPPSQIQTRTWVSRYRCS